MNRVPDVLGSFLDEALSLLEEEGFIPEIKITLPAGKGTDGEGAYRVVRQKPLHGNHVELVFAIDKGGKEVGEVGI